MTHTGERVAVVGAGAMGSIIGAGLAQGGVDVTLVDTWAEHIEAINKDGLRIESEDGVETVRVDATTSVDGVGPVDLLIVLVKAQHTGDVMGKSDLLLADGGAALSLQNGIGNEDIVAAAVGSERTLAGSLYFGGIVLGPGTIRCSARDAAVIVGAVDPAGRPAAENAHRLLRQGGFNAELQDDVLAIKWQKVLLNVAVSAITGILGEPIRVAGDRPEVRQAMIAACAEGMEIARRKGMALIGGDDPARYVSAGVDIHDYKHKASMCLDIEAGRPTEIEFMNGAMVRFGQELGVPTPINTVLTVAVRRLENLAAASSGPIPS